MSSPISIILRARNDMPLIKETIEALASQKTEFRLFAFDNNSTDGTREEIEKIAYQIVDVPEGTYVPGKVLNQGMELADSEKVVFLNSDCTPQNENWLSELIQGFDHKNCAAVFGRQMPRGDCLPIFFKDTEDTFGNGEKQKYWKHCFSMASSAVSKEVWEKHPFREDIQYSEDIDWTWRMRQLGFTIKYVPNSMVTHSHNYSPGQFYKRQFGEGKADAQIFTWTKWEGFWLRYSLMPFVRQVISDLKYGLKKRELTICYQSPIYRMAQMLGRRKGFLEGMANRSEK